MSRDKKASYYDAGGIETIDIVRAKLTKEQFVGYLLGTQIVYLSRVNFKHERIEDQLRDIEKAEIYGKWLKEEMENLVEKPTQIDPNCILSGRYTIANRRQSEDGLE